MTVRKRRARVGRAGSRAAALGDLIELVLDDTRANGENAAHASIYLEKEHVDVSLGRVAVWNPGAYEPKMPNVSKFRATKPRIEEADVHVRLPAPRLDQIFSRHPTSVSANRAIIPSTLTRKTHDGSHRLHRVRSRRADRRARDGVARRARRGTLLARPSAVRGVVAAQPNRAESARSRAALRRTYRSL